MHDLEGADGIGGPPGALPATNLFAPAEVTADQTTTGTRATALDRALDLLDQLATARVAVVCAPTGFGKAALVDAWFVRHPEHQRFTIATADDLAAVREGATSPTAADPDGLFVLVLVDGVVRDPQVAAAALELAERDPGTRVVFVSRFRPDVPLGALGARGLVVDIDARQLAWRADELAAALRVHTPCTDDQAVALVMERTAGWPLVAWLLSQQPLTWEHQEKLTRLVDSFCRETVLDSLPPADLRLLEAAATLPQLEPAALAAITGQDDAVAHLSRLQAQGVPITWQHGALVGLNPLLRDLLSRQLRETDPARAAEHARRGALWLRQKGRVAEAITVALDAGQVDLAWTIGGEAITRSIHGPQESSVVAEVLEALPDGPELELLRSIVANMATPQTWIAQLEAIDVDRMGECGPTGRLGYTALLLGMLRMSGYPARVDVGLAIEIVRTTDPQTLDEPVFAILSVARKEHGLWLLHRGQFFEAQQVLLGALGAARVARTAWVEAATLGALALVHALLGTVDQARALAEESLSFAAATELEADHATEHALLAMALVSVDVGDAEAARGWLDRLNPNSSLRAENDPLRTYLRAMVAMLADDSPTAARLVTAHRDGRTVDGPVWHQMLVHLAAFTVHIAMDDVASAEQQFAILQGFDLPPEVDGHDYLAARLDLARQDVRAAFQRLLPLTSRAEAPHPVPKVTLHMLMLFGVAADAMHRPGEALDAIQRAGVLAERLGLHGAAALHTRAAADTRRDTPLTEAERNVLAHLRPDRTLTQTAEALFVSPNTLKTHLRGIYRKLGVANREEAIERAKVLGITQPG